MVSNPNAHNIALPYCQMDHQLLLVIYGFETVKPPLERPRRDLVKADLGVDYWITSLAGYSMKPFHQTKLHFPSNQRICDRCGDGGHVFRRRRSHAPSILLLENKVFSASIHRPLYLPKIRRSTQTSSIQIR